MKKKSNRNFIQKLIRRFGRKKVILMAFALLLVLLLSSAGITQAVSSPRGEFEHIRIYLSPSNQFSNFYATGNTNEMEQCDKIAEAAEKQLKQMGFTVMLGRSGDTIQNRCSESNGFDADMHIPIHTNAFDGDYVGGTRIYVNDSAEDAAAQCFLDTVGAISPGTEDKIDYKPDLYEIYTPKAKSVYVECEFHDTQKGAQWIEDNTDNIASAIAYGVYNYYSNK